RPRIFWALHEVKNNPIIKLRVGFASIYTKEALSAFIFAGLFRTVMVHQYTFFINSLAHIWGKQTYGTQFTAKDNHFISLFTYGEGYHNFHHHFQNDYRNGIRWYDYDPTKWSINFLSSLGLAYKLKTTPEQEIILAKVKERSRSLSTKKTELFDQWAHKIEPIKERMDQCALHLKTLQDEYNKLKMDFKSRGDLKVALLKREIKMARRELKLRYAHWKAIVAHLEKAQIQPMPL
ncbi:MAG: acyl-CoA desaturase, partial [Bdellovibrionales bacterium]|nr:acyl-CoA desaturase [Bdellovibrionales bacterium]NQZ19321.1 acyl-CoA desaturase [Bdellovibrionales bacterium]